MAPTPLSYHLPSIRLNTFNKKRKGALKNLNWSNITTTTDLEEQTDNLVNEGFYHSPSTSTPFNIKCYLCSLEIPTPPFLLSPPSEISSIHLSLSPECSYALIRSTSRESDALSSGKKFDEKKVDCWGEKGSNWPKGLRMEEARLGSFMIGWPWEGVDGLPTKEEIAKAGWYFRPGFETDENDQCVCPCCTRTVGGWEEGDDPIALHHKKEGLTCSFFTSTIDPSLQFVEVAKEVIEEEAVVPAPAPKSSKSTKATPASSKATASVASGSTRSTGRSTKSKAAKETEVEVEVEPEVEAEEEVEEEKEEVQPSQSTRSSRRKVIAPSSDTEEISKAPLKKSTRATKASKKASPVVVIPEVSPEPEEVEAIVEEVPETEAIEPEPEPEVEVVVPVPVKAKKGKGRPAKSQVQVPVVAAEEAVLVVEPVQEVIEEEVVVGEEVILVAPVKKVPKPKKSAAPKASKGKGKAVPIIVDDEEEVIPEADEDIPMDQISAVGTVVEAAPLEEEDTVMEELSVSTSKIIVEVEIPVKMKGSKSKASKSRSTTSIVAPVSAQNMKEPILVVDGPVITTTPAVASPSPSRPIKSLPSKPISNKVPLPSLTSTTTSISTSTKSITSKSTLSKPSSKPSSKSSENPSPPSSSILPSHSARPNPFSSSNNLLPTTEELNLTIKEYYDLCGSRNYDTLEKEMKIDLEGLKARIGVARGYLVEMCGGEN